MSTNWSCRAYRPGDEADIIQLYRDVFQLEMAPTLWKWMYQLPPAGPAVIVVLQNGERIAGHYGVQLRDFKDCGRRVTVGIAVGTMVLPELRSVAALVAMAELAYQICRDRGIPWLYAFPNDVAHRVRCALLGWRAQPEIVEWEGPLPAARSANANALQTWTDLPDLDFEPLFRAAESHHVASQNLICASRSRAWLRWRFFDRPGGEYVLHTLASDQQVAAYAVTKRYVRDGVQYGHILDWLVPAADASRSTELFDSIWRQFREWNVQRVSCWARGNRELGALLASVGLSLTGRKSNFCVLDLAGGRSDRLVQETIWRVEMADSDVY